MSSERLSRRALLGSLAAGAGAAAALPAFAESPASPSLPVAPDDPSTVLGTPSLPTSPRSPFVPEMAIKPSNVTTGPGYAPIQDFFGTITPTDLQFQRHHAGIPLIDPAKWKLLVHGMTDKALAFGYEDIRRFPSVTRVAFLECSGNGRNAYRAPKEDLTAQKIDGLINNLEWTGVPLSLVLREAGVKPEAKWLFAEGGDASRLARSIPLEKAMDDALLVYAANGEPLRQAHGFPVRLFLPGWEANMSVKWLRRLELRAEPVMTRDETGKYTDPLADGTVRMFSWVLDAKSIITQPSHPTRLSGPGWWPVTGIAWSGRGRIQRVEVSTDDGASWSEAELLGKVEDKAVVRFRHMWRWDGQPTVLLSRATDETGYVQPSLAEFKKVRGAGTDYHFNFIRGWRIAQDGAVFFRPEPEAP